MTVEKKEFQSNADIENLKATMERYFDRLWPICRSIMGHGFRESLNILSEIMPMEQMIFASGEKVLDWIVPDEWVIRDAYFIDPNGKKRADFKKNNLHVVGYSEPFSGSLSLAELKDHLHSIPDYPDLIPYLTTYYARYWGFCLAHEELNSLPNSKYEVKIDSEFRHGNLVVGESIDQGRDRSVPDVQPRRG